MKTPKKKLLKRNRRTWGINPVQKVDESKKVYKRTRIRFLDTKWE